MNGASKLSPQRGFLVIAGVFLIVVLAGLVAYLTTVSTTSQAASAADLNSARAYQAARSGTEWAAYLLLRGSTGAGTFLTDCAPGPTTKTLALGSTLSGFTVTVTCSSSAYTEGGVSVTRYSITSNACNEPTGGGACPNAATISPTYVDREVNLAISN